MTGRDPFASYLARMQAAGFRPSSSLGQNFLLDPTLHRWIAECAAPQPQDTVLEVGVGLGFLTRELAARAGTVVAIEIDARLLQLAREELGELKNVEWVHGDALGGTGRTLHPEALAAAGAAQARGAQLLVVANLPYAVAGPLLVELAVLAPLPARAVLLVQKELAQRVAAPCGSADYGGLGALVQAVFTATLARDVPPQVFRPRPKVMSSILVLEPRRGGPLAAATTAMRRSFAAFVRALFQQRRKMLRRTLPAAAAAVGRQPLPLSPAELEARAESVPPDRLVEWWSRCPPAGEPSG